MKKIITKSFIRRKKAMAENVLVSGPGIDRMLKTIEGMLARGAPVELDMYGGSGVSFPIFRKISGQYPVGSSMPWSDVISAMNALKIHKKTQVLDYEDIKVAVTADYERSKGIIQTQQPSVDNPKRIRFLGGSAYGKLDFEIKNLSRYPKVKESIRAEMEQREAQGDSRFQQTYDQYSRKMEYPVFKAFSKSKNHMDAFTIDPSFIPVVEPVLKGMGYDTAEMLSYNQVGGTASSPEGAKKEQKTVHAKLDGGSITISFSEYINQILRQAVKTQGFYGSKLPDGNFIWISKNPDPEKIINLMEFLSNQGWDVKELADVLQQVIDSKKERQTKGGDFEFDIRVRDVTGETNNQWHMGLSFLKSGTWEGETFKEILKFSFGNYVSNTSDKGSRTIYKPPGNGSWETFLAGNYQEYRNFISSLKNRGFNYIPVQQIVDSLIQRGLVTRMEGVGDLDGFDNKEQFYQEIDKYKLPFELYPEQKEGVARAYSHRSFLRGDETGVGKTVISILAGEMRRKRSGKRVVVVTKSPVQSQFLEQVARFLRIDPNDKTLLSTNPQDKAQWTVLSYEYFKSPEIQIGTMNGREQIVSELVQQAKSGEIECLILDECHNVKNGRPYSEDLEKDLLASQADPQKRSPSGIIYSTFYMQKFSQSIPFVWGLSATVVANKPIDVYNQLKAINHPLGKLSWGRFAQFFGGMHQEPVQTPSGPKMVWKDGSIDDQLDAVNKLKEYLIDQNAYDALSKKQINKKMPDQIITADPVEINEEDLNARISARMSNYKGASEVSAMIAYRNEIAIEKAPETARQAIPILEQNKKVMIFSDFRDSVDIISNSIQEFFDQRRKGEQVLSIRGGMRHKKRDEAKALFQDQNSKVRCLVLNIVAGGTGLDFPNVTNDVFINDFDWSVANDEQMLGRPYRINSESDVNVKYILAAPTETEIAAAEAQGIEPQSSDMAFYNRVKVKKEIARIIHTLSMEQDALFKEGKRRGKSEELSEVEKKLNEAKKRYIAMEERDKDFEARMAHKIRKQTEGKTQASRKKNWFKRASKRK